MNNQSAYAVATLRNWHSNHESEISDLGIQSEFKSWGDKAEIQLCSDQYLASICAWDHESCLDIIVVDTRTGKEAYSTAGSCADEAEFIQHLNDNLSWLRSAHATRPEQRPE